MNEEIERFTEKSDFTQLAYTELCSSYKAIDDFRQKLLGLLPLVSGASIFAFKDGDKQSTIMALFGVMVTLGLLIFEIHGTRKCAHLIVVGKLHERILKIEGQFRNRPEGLKGMPFFKKIAPYINEPLASGIIYPSVLGGWTYLAISNASRPLAAIVGGAVFLIGFSAMYWFNKQLVDTDTVEKEKEFQPTASSRAPTSSTSTT